MNRIIRKTDLVAARWSGGATTQLAIYPPEASYAGRDFLWRVSTASVDAERSDFTPLPGVSRILMVLDGTLRLIYNGSREVTLHRFGQDSFSGGWNTESIGRARDFNLMMMEGCSGSVEVLELFTGEHEAPRLHTAEGIRNCDFFTDIDAKFQNIGEGSPAGDKGRIISEVYYALTSVRLMSHANGMDRDRNDDIVQENEEGGKGYGIDINLNSGDVYIRSSMVSGLLGDMAVPEKLEAVRNAGSPAILVRALIIHNAS